MLRSSRSVCVRVRCVTGVLRGSEACPAAHLPGFFGQRGGMLVIIRAAAVVATALGTALAIAACGGAARPAPRYLAGNGGPLDLNPGKPSSGSNMRGALREETT